jgi:Mg2+ and Co2+ transporter CorA
MPKVTSVPSPSKKELADQIQQLRKQLSDLVISTIDSQRRIHQLETDMISYGQAMISYEDELSFFRRLYQESNNPYNSTKVLATELARIAQTGSNIACAGCREAQRSYKRLGGPVQSHGCTKHGPLQGESSGHNISISIGK